MLGLLAEAGYTQACREIGAGDVLVLYSDGLVECTNAAGEEYGEGRLLELLQGKAGKDPESVRDAVTTAVAEFLGGVPPRDDLTLVVAQFA